MVPCPGLEPRHPRWQRGVLTIDTSTVWLQPGESNPKGRGMNPPCLHDVTTATLVGREGVEPPQPEPLVYSQLPSPVSCLPMSWCCRVDSNHSRQVFNLSCYH